MFLYIHDLEGSVSNCHLKEINVSWICSGANMKWEERDITKGKINCLV